MNKAVLVLAGICLTFLAACNTAPVPVPPSAATEQPTSESASTAPTTPVEQPSSEPAQANPAPKPRSEPAPKPAVQQAPKSQPKPVAEAKPAPPRTVTLPAGTVIQLEMAQAASSKTSAVGDATSARVVEDVVVSGEVVVPKGAVVSGTVAEANPANRFAGISSLGLHFDTLELPSGKERPVDFTYRVEKRGEKKKDAATIGGATVGGAILGRILKDDKSEGTKEGAIAGAVIGTAIAGATKGQEVELPTGTAVQVELTTPVTVTL
jgi:hypothetical protein